MKHLHYLLISSRVSSRRLGSPLFIAGLALTVWACSDSKQGEEPSADDVPSEPSGEGGGGGSTPGGGDDPEGAGGTSGADPSGRGGAESTGGRPNADYDAGSGNDPAPDGDGGASGGSGAGGSGAGGSGAGGSGAGGSGAGGNGGYAGSSGGNAGSGGGDEETNSEFGFSIRAPGEDDLDWLCTFGQAEAEAYVYVRLTQTGTMQAGIATVPVYSASLAQLSLDGAVSDLDNAAYDYGGGHHNDSLQFDYGGQTYKYYHSSFGFGFRACQYMDCLDVYEGADLLTQGCGSDRALPEVCVQIGPDGSHEPLEDNFQKCPGDSN